MNFSGTLRPSYQANLYLGIIHLGAFLGAMLTPLPNSSKLAILIFLTISLAAYHLQQNRTRLIVWESKQNWLIREQTQWHSAKLQSYYLSAWLIVLEFQLSYGKKAYLVLFPDSIRPLTLKDLTKFIQQLH